MERLTLLDIVKKLISSDEYEPDVQWCLSELRDILEIVGDMSGDRLRELAETDREGRCVVVPRKIRGPVFMATGRSRITGYEEDICDGFFIGRDMACQIKSQNYKGNHGTYGTIADGSAQISREAAEKALDEKEKSKDD